MSNEEANGRTPGRNPDLERLNRLIGEWELEVSLDGQTYRGGHVTFEWLEDGAFLVQRSEVSDLSTLPPGWVENAPRSTVSIIGLDDTSEQFWMLYADSRDVFRVYKMSLSDEVWGLRRDAPEFSQRFTSNFDDDANVIEGTWEYSDDGVDWEVDFDVTYTRTGA
ncbi:hypothetical protein [Natronosalvus halobius]|uniref:hypothetical protein n=1 Tax=Natronosalvus halobius TaxID=2953746 RepID=UPI00209FA353|nr:hypothetical protein [Natronosalvus halobius]USZ70289.1 hypothetical protein NGM15_09150 [Natronosalvus halobius]